MRTRAMVILAVAGLISATTSVFAAESMKHDMQRDLHERMGMTADEPKEVRPVQQTITVAYMKHDMQLDLHVNTGMVLNDPKETVTTFASPTDPNVYKP